jgi:hypothetical protein
VQNNLKGLGLLDFADEEKMRLAAPMAKIGQNIIL